MSTLTNTAAAILGLILGLAVPAGASLPGTPGPAPAGQSVTTASAQAVPPGLVTPASHASSTSPTPQAEPATTHRVVYLTFDDGPSRTYTPQVLAVLRRHHAKATFFMLGNNASVNRSLVAKVKAAGHEVANHTWSHPQLTRLSNSAIRSQISRTDAVIGRTTCLRPPYGSTNSRVRSVIASTGHASKLWTVDPQDWARPGSKTIASRVLRATGIGDIVLFHDGGGDRSQTVAALDVVLTKLAAKGYRFATLPGC